MSGDEHIDDSTLKQFLSVIHRWTGITLAPNRVSMLQGRIRPRLRALGLTTAREYFDHVIGNDVERQEFIDAITTNETYFYRTPRVWEWMARTYLPSWFKVNPQRTLHVWSAAASTGEEAHTLALVCHAFREQHPSFQYRILGTDICTQVLSVAERGIYAGRSIEHLKKGNPVLLQKYMRACGDCGYQVLPGLKSQVQFKRHNLFEVPKFGIKFDLVFLRNVLIYFSQPDQERVLQLVASTMQSGSGLVLGEAESLNQLNTPFRYESPLIYSFPEKAAA